MKKLDGRIYIKNFGEIYRFLQCPSNKTPALTKGTNMGIWVVGTTNQLFKGGSYRNKIFKK